MCIMMLKNALLFFFIILILHFMIQNKLIESRNDSKRQMVITETMNGAKIANEAVSATSDIGSGVKDTTVETMTEYAPVVTEGKPIEEVFEKEDKVVDECKLSCDSFKEEPPVVKEENKMKDLYDFVFSEENHTECAGSKNGGLDEFFPKNVVDKVVSDVNEVDVHRQNVKLQQPSKDHFRCNFEVVGSLCNSSNNDSIEGIETLTTASSFYAEL